MASHVPTITKTSNFLLASHATPGSISLTCMMAKFIIKIWRLGSKGAFKTPTGGATTEAIIIHFHAHVRICCSLGALIDDLTRSALVNHNMLFPIISYLYPFMAAVRPWMPQSGSLWLFMLARTVKTSKWWHTLGRFMENRCNDFEGL